MKSPAIRCPRSRSVPTAVVLAIAGVFAIVPTRLRAQTEGEYLYRVAMLRAAPGEFNELIATLTASADLIQQAGDEAPFWMRHSQGDQWDFMLLYPMAEATAYFAPERAAARQAAWGSPAGQALRTRLDAETAYHEEWFARSVPLDQMRVRFDGMGFFHIEMFAGLPGKRAELVEQRRMENRYYEHLGRQQNVLFLREGGSNWDAMTIGFYKDLQTFAAAGARSSTQQQDEAARVAGFEGVRDISPYLRSLLAYHHDTLAVRVR